MGIIDKSIGMMNIQTCVKSSGTTQEDAAQRHHTDSGHATVAVVDSSGK